MHRAKPEAVERLSSHVVARFQVAVHSRAASLHADFVQRQPMEFG